jgi:hypothetical protein
MKKYAVIAAVLLVSGAFAQSKPSAAKPTASAPRLTSTASMDGYSLPIGTVIRMKLETPISSATSQRGDHFGGRVIEAVKMNGRTVIPVGAAVEGDVTRTEEKRRIKGTSMIDLLPRVITMPDGQRYNIIGNVVDTSNSSDVNVTEEGQIRANGHDRNDLIETGIGTAVGAGVGAAIGGGKGFLIGAAVGGGATVVHWLTKTKSADLPAGTELFMQLSRPMQLTTEAGD